MRFAEQPSEHQADLWQDLAEQLGEWIARLSSSSPPRRVPLGDWLRDDLLLEAARTAGDVVREAAFMVGMPESTYRRRLRAAIEQEEAGLATRMEGWEEVRQVLSDLTRAMSSGEGDLHDRTQTVLLRKILARYPSDVKAGAQLLGVSPPTFRRRARLLDPTS